MEKLLHYAWQHKMLPAHPLVTDSGERVDVIDPGLPNNDAGPDFFNAKVRLDGVLWVGNVEIHERASDWHRHGHQRDAAYDNVVLHVCRIVDDTAHTAGGRALPQLRLDVPQAVADNYRELLAEAAYPPCYRVIPDVPKLAVHAWLNVLATERLEEKTQRINRLLEQTAGDWERTFFITLARNFGFGVNTEAFELWARHIDLSTVGKHRDNAFQVEAFFMGQAGLLDDGLVPPERRDDYFTQLRKEYGYLAHKFGMRPIDPKVWRFLRLRPQNFPHVRLAQLTTLYSTYQTDFSRLMGATSVASVRQAFRVGVTPYWETHYTFGRPTAAHPKLLQEASLDLLLINTVAPLLFAYGRHCLDEERCERAFALLEQTKAERNHITRSWAAAGVAASNAADSQALIRLRHYYCDTKDCLRCRFGAAYLRRPAPHPAPGMDTPAGATITTA